MRRPRPFFRTQTKTWYVQIGRRQFNLGSSEKAAWARYYELMVEREAIAAQPVTVAELFELYLEWCLNRRAPGTYANNRRYLRSFVANIGKQFAIGKLRSHHVVDWVAEHAQWTDTSQHDAISIVQRPFNWAVKQGRLDRNPIAHIDEKPSRRRREVVYSPDDWKKLRSLIADEEFRDFLDFLWETGCRPQEARTLEARHVDIQNAVVVFPPSEAKGKKHERVIFLTDVALEIVKRLCRRHTVGPIFRNSRGNPWTKDSIKCRFQRLKDKAGMPDLCAYGFRHSYATEGLKNGVDSVCLAALMGHSDLSMIARTYQHLARNPQFLREQARKAKGA